MPKHLRTAIRRLRVTGYRSLADVEVEDLPDLVVLLGPNGVGKSNLLRAARMALGLLNANGVRRAGPGRLRLDYAGFKATFGVELNPLDFRVGQPRDLRIEVDLELGAWAENAAGQKALGTARLAVDISDVGGALEVGYERAHGPDFSFLPPPRGPGDSELAAEVERLEGLRRSELETLQSMLSAKSGGAGVEKRTRKLEATRARLDRTTADLARARRDLGSPDPPVLRLCDALSRRAVRVSEAYRRPETGEPELYRAMLAAEPERRVAVRRLAALLSKATIFGTQEAITLSPVDDQRVFVARGDGPELPLSHLGTGQQQVILLLADQILSAAPISQIEEPEAHLHASLMEPYARLLVESVESEAPATDQLWLCTHHHHFVVAPRFLDVSLDAGGATRVRWRDRPESIAHFYEPTPYWSALEDLLRDGLSPDTALSLDEQGRPVTAAALLESITGDRALADRFVAASLRAVLQSLVEDP